MRAGGLATFVLLAVMAFGGSAAAEIEKVAHLDESQISFVWWPKLPSVPGWEHDPGTSQHYGMYAMKPIGETFKDAASVIYGKAIFKPRAPDTKSLSDLIAADEADFRAQDPDLAVTELDGIVDAAGRRLRIFAFKPTGEGNWEAVAYGEEADSDSNPYWLIVVLSARSQADYDAAMPAFRQMLAAYR